MKKPSERTQLAILSVLAATILIASAVALSGRGEVRTGPTAGGGPTASAAPLSSSGSGGPRSSAGASGPLSGRTSSGSVSAPSKDVLKGPAVTKNEVKVGITYTAEAGSANSAAGFGSIAQIDQRRGWEAVVKDVNTNPPFGRRIVPVWYAQTENEISSKGSERVAQEACARFTRDAKVFMVWVGTLGAGEATLSACLTKAKIPSIAFGTGTSYGKTFGDYPYLVEPGAAAMDRMAGFYVDQLFAAHFFSAFKNNSAPYTPTKPPDGKARIGLIRYDTLAHKAGAATLKKHLAAHGFALCSGCEFQITYSPSDVQMQLDDATEINAAIQNCKNRAGGACTHMLFLGSTAQRIPTFFMDGAERQLYRPRIGLSPLDSWTFVRDFLGPTDTEPQYRDGMLLTWNAGDFGERTAAFTRCQNLFKAAGETFAPDEAADKNLMIPGYCDTAWFFAAAMKATGSALAVPAWLRGVESVSPIAGAGPYVIRTKTGRHDGVGAVRIGAWSDGCHCFKPSTGVVGV